jgi:hypothetical protein
MLPRRKIVTTRGVITAKVGEITGSARIRVVPPFPWSYDFDNGEIPITWVGIRYRHVPIDFDLLQKLKQRNPAASELYIYLTSTFINNEIAPGKLAKFDDSTPRKAWNDFADFMKILPIAGDLEQTKAAIDPLLEILKAEKVVDGWNWETWTSNEGGVNLKGVRLSVTRGPRKLRTATA